MALNLPTFYIDSAARTPREAEVPDADFTGGMNTGASNAPGVGVNTGDYDPKVTDWQPPVGVPAAVQTSQIIGGAQTGLLVLDPATAGDDEVTAFVTATGDVAPDDVVETVAGFPLRNRTGKTVPTGASVWAVGDQL